MVESTFMDEFKEVVTENLREKTYLEPYFGTYPLQGISKKRKRDLE